ncbi:NAD(P)/FAD-dependent oxidoreductase [uncultured Flavonifractor sp.]|uniref:NAD(P)/FAD-dependent oxidoreductase n=1 Tax=uncultured Flavonifractor sp. TaxID=1193534 RepID=UPI00263A1C1C|nr:FAD-dependent oxidoreductase [uncultured Flavonifractor sp.]
MNVERHQAVVVGGGPAGLAAAIQLREKGIDDVVILEREHRTGGILRQCIHDGFGLTRFGETLSGPEYAQRFVDRAEELGIPCLTDTTVLTLEADRTLTASGPAGLRKIQGDAVILTMGCRERTRGALAIPGSRPAGIYTAGVAQEYINLRNLMVGREVVILGSGDIGLIMARRMTLEGAHVKGVYEVQPYPSGLPRNIEQCLNDYNIPLHLSHTVTDIHGRERLEGVTISQVDEHFRPIPGTEERVDCDTLILSVGLIPAGDIANGSGLAVDGRTKGAFVDEHYQTNLPGVFSAGNVLHVHDLVDFVSLEAEALAAAAAEYLKQGSLPPCPLEVKAGKNVGHVIPQRISGKRGFTLSLRVRQPMKKVTLTVTQNGREVLRRKFPKALPAEMIQLAVAAEKLETTGDLEVSVE